jgi:predicted dehydrogenase
MEKLKLGIIGTGHLGKLHVKMFKQIPECEITAVYDADKAQLDSAVSEFNVPGVNNLEELLNLTDAVSIAATTKYIMNLLNRLYLQVSMCLLKNR